MEQKTIQELLESGKGEEEGGGRVHVVKRGSEG